MAEQVAYTRCWNTSGGSAPTQFLTIADNCPCVQYGGAESTGSNNQVCLKPSACKVCKSHSAHAVQQRQPADAVSDRCRQVRLRALRGFW